MPKALCISWVLPNYDYPWVIPKTISVLIHITQAIKAYFSVMVKITISLIILNPVNKQWPLKLN
jgi:hypothetical protein